MSGLTKIILHGDCLAQLRLIEDNKIDSLVTDPPAGISFMDKAWDGDKGGRKQWVAWMTEVMAEAMRVMKPGAHGLVWALPRTSHWTATALEDAGFEIRDVVTHLFGSGFPKSLDVSKAIDKAAGAKREVIGRYKDPSGNEYRPTPGRTNPNPMDWETKSEDRYLLTAPATDAAKQWQGWGTALKPASEHWILVRKPCSERTVAANVLKWGTGAINIDASRIEGIKPQTIQGGRSIKGASFNGNDQLESRKVLSDNSQGRFPANLVLDEEAAAMLGEQSGASKSQAGGNSGSNANPMSWDETNKARPRGGHTDSGDASRFFYVAKASKSDKGAENTHPTVKSTKLMEYLIRMITPIGGIVLDPFMGSGSTGVAAIKLGYSFIGVEKEKEYIDIAKTRIEAVT